MKLCASKLALLLFFLGCAQVGTGLPESDFVSDEGTSTNDEDVVQSEADVSSADVTSEDDDATGAQDEIVESDVDVETDEPNDIQETLDAVDVGEQSETITDVVTSDSGTGDDDVGSNDDSSADLGPESDVPDCDDDNPCTEDFFDGEECVNTYVYGVCCSADPMCDDDNPCTDDICLEGFCTHEVSCCEADGDCADKDDVCTTEECVDGYCMYTPTLDVGCCEEQLYENNFDPSSPASPFSIENSSEDVGWHVSDQGQSSSAPNALWYGNSVSQNYDSGIQNSGEVTFPTKTLPGGVQVFFKFDLYVDVEYGTLFDLLQVRMKIDGAPKTLVVFDKTKVKYYNAWHSVQIDLTGFAGKKVTLSVFFDTVDEGQNTGKGVFLDNISFESTCTPRSCTIDAQCNDGLGATLDVCVDGWCSYKANSNYCITSKDCDDGEPCTYNTCSQNQCYYSKMTNCCLADTDCDDGNLCTLDDCMGAYAGHGGYCKHIDVPNCCLTDNDCNDGDPCTKDSCPGPGELCVFESIAGCCKEHVDCTDDDPCTENLCVSGSCFSQTICCAEDADCSDGGEICTSEACVDGVCQTTLIDQPGCCKTPLLSTDFTGPSLLGWNISADSNNADLVTWKPVSYKSVSPGGALHYGKGTPNGNYDTATQNSGSITSTAFAIPATTVSFLSFWLYLDNEWSNGVGSLDWDHLTVEAFPVSKPDNVLLLWESSSGEPKWWAESNGKPIQGKWTKIDKLELNALKGQLVRLKFSFDTVDGDANSFEGVFIDDVRVESTCGP